MEARKLEELGLTRGESTVYLTLLGIGETTTGKIIDNAEISAGKVYQILEKLVKKGLVTYILKQKTKYFQATHPNNLLEFIKKKEEMLKEEEMHIKNCLPELIKEYCSSEEPQQAKIYKGQKGLQTAIYELLDLEKGEILAMGITTKRHKKYNLLWQAWHKEREEQKIQCKSLFSDLPKTLQEEYDKYQRLEVRILKGITPSAITIRGKTTLIQTYGHEPSCTLIHSKDTATSFKTFFETLWKTAKP